MIVDLPDVSIEDITRRLVTVRNDAGAMALGRVLTLVISVDAAHCEDAVRSAITASYLHPSRVVVVVNRGVRGRSRVDGEIRVGGHAGAAEVILLYVRGPVAAHPAALAAPLLLPDSPIVGWWPHRAPDDTATDPLGRLCQRCITDSAAVRTPAAELARRAEAYRPGDTDLAWSRISRWRAIVAATLDQGPTDDLSSAVVVGASDSPSVDLLAGWLASRLDIPVQRVRAARGRGVVSVRLTHESGNVDVVRPKDSDRGALISPHHPPRRVALAHRSTADCLADELRHLDADEIYEEALTVGIPRLETPSATAAALARQGSIPDEADARTVLRMSRRTASR